MMPATESGLRRKLDKLGYRLTKRNGGYCITDHQTGGAVHETTVTQYCLDLDDVQEWAGILAAGE